MRRPPLQRRQRRVWRQWRADRHEKTIKQQTTPPAWHRAKTTPPSVGGRGPVAPGTRTRTAVDRRGCWRNRAPSRSGGVAPRLQPYRRPAGGWGRRQWPLRAWRARTLDATVRRQVVGVPGEQGARLKGRQWGCRCTGVLVTPRADARCAAQVAGAPVWPPLPPFDLRRRWVAPPRAEPVTSLQRDRQRTPPESQCCSRVPAALPTNPLPPLSHAFGAAPVTAPQHSRWKTPCHSQ